MVLIPPALVAIVPPTVADSREARFTPYARPAAAACARNSAIVTPAPAVTWAASLSTGPSSRSRRVDSTTAARPRLAGGGTDPPTRPVLPPCGTTAAPCSAQARSTAATWAVDPGRTAHSASPAYLRVQSAV